MRQIILTGGQAADVKVSLDLLQSEQPRKVIADKAYDADWLLHYLDSEHIEAVIPPKKSRLAQRPVNYAAYKERNVIEQTIIRMKQYRKIATRYERSPSLFWHSAVLPPLSLTYPCRCQHALATIAAIILFCIVMNYSSISSSSSFSDNTSYTSSGYNRSQSGDLYQNNSLPSVDTSVSIYNSNQSASNNVENYSDWDAKNYKSGSSPGCYNFTPRYNKSLDNKLEVIVGYNTDLVLKLINSESGRCIRYVYIQSGDVFNIKNIPEGKYYLKTAYGKDWRQNTINGKCVGKFILNALYKKGNEILDFEAV